MAIPEILQTNMLEEVFLALMLSSLFVFRRALIDPTL